MVDVYKRKKEKKLSKIGSKIKSLVLFLGRGCRDCEKEAVVTVECVKLHL